ncbi:MAG: hypothetical protein HLUCCA11_18935 [Phormidesmis priestleyi Ana]|uniref:AAA ATPase domain n=1 Tax=Phormidesmis priestleyi Ana TaxID=1666911 RepID=A0A0P7YSC4_9CYAN|nr:MAG: hypothetical protein HLUCCA11_18935 [Phormidesmis priestleyi Ana]
MVDINIETTIPDELNRDLKIAKGFVNLFKWKYYSAEDKVIWRDLHRRKALSETELKAVTCLLKGFSKKEIKKRINNLEGHALVKKVESFRKTVERVKKYLEFICVYKEPIVSPCTDLRNGMQQALDSDNIIDYLSSKGYEFLQAGQSAPVMEENLYGREKLVNAMLRNISEKRTQMLLLQGPLGIGKKSIGRAIAQALTGQFAQSIQQSENSAFYNIDFGGFAAENGNEAYHHLIHQLSKLSFSIGDLALESEATNNSKSSFLLEKKNKILEELKNTQYAVVLEDFKAFEHDDGDPFYVFFSDFLRSASQSLFIFSSVVSIPFIRDLEEKGLGSISQKRIKGIDFDAATQMLLDSGLKKEPGLNKIIDTYSGNPGELRIISRVIKRYFEASPDAFVEQVIDDGSVFLSELNGYEKILARCPDSALEILQKLGKENISTFSFRKLLSLFGASVNQEFKLLRELSLIDEQEDSIGQYTINPVVRRSLEKYFSYAS